MVCMSKCAKNDKVRQKELILNHFLVKVKNLISYIDTGSPRLSRFFWGKKNPHKIEIRANWGLI